MLRSEESDKYHNRKQRVFRCCSYFFVVNESQTPPIMKRVCFHQCWVPLDEKVLTNLSYEKHDEIIQHMIVQSNAKLSVLLKELKIQKWYPMMGLVTEFDFESKTLNLYYYHDDTLSVSLGKQSKYLNEYNLSLDNTNIYSHR